MVIFNDDAIRKKINATLDTSEQKRKIDNIVGNYMLGTVGISMAPGGGKAVKPIEQAASKFIEVLRAEIASHAGGDRSAGGLGPSAIAGLSELDYGTPYKVGNKYYIDVYFDGDLSRPSLAPERFDGVENIAALLNSGYVAGNRVYGVWEKHGDERIASMVRRGGAHFIEQAKANFMGNYASEYGVIDIEVDEIYGENI